MRTVEISGIPWNEELFYLQEETSILNNFYTPENDYYIIKGIWFSQDIWDFQAFNKLEQDKFIFVYDFRGIDYRFRNYIKRIVLHLFIIKKRRAKTVYSHFMNICNFLKNLEEERIFYYELLDVDIVKNYLNSKKWSDSYLASNISSIKLVLSEIGHANKYNFKDIHDYFKEEIKVNHIAQRESGKTKIIPYSVYNKIVAFALKDIINTEVPHIHKVIACMIVILAETGVRVGELVRLERGKLDYIIVDDCRKIPYLKFKTYKTIEKNKYDYVWTESYVTDKVKLAYETLEKLSEENKTITDYICVIPKAKTKVTEHAFRNYIKLFMARHYYELNLEAENASDLKELQKKVFDERSQKSLSLLFREFEGYEIFYPTPHQFRVTVCTILYELGIPLDFIRKHMNHIDEDMTVHYIRSEKFKVQKRRAIEQLKSIICEDGTSLNVNKLANKDNRKDYERINRFIKANKINVKKDLDEILRILATTDTPIFEIPEGFCARMAFLNICERQEYISSRNDLYYLGLKIPSIDFAKFTYKRFLDKSKIVIYNRELALKDPKFNLEYRREEKGLRKYIEKKLIPEFNLITEKVNRIGLENFKKEHPDLVDLVKRIENIMDEEVKPWIQEASN